MQPILLELTLPLLLTSDYESRLWSEDPIEYIRLQVDNSNSWNVKRTNAGLVKAICNIRQTRRQKIGPFLTSFLNLLVETLTQINSNPNPSALEMGHKEALMHAFGLLATHMAYDSTYKVNAEGML